MRYNSSTVVQVPYLNELCGEGYRLDHMPLVIESEKGAEGFSLHGGTINADGNYVKVMLLSQRFCKPFAGSLPCLSFLTWQNVQQPPGLQVLLM